MTENYHSSEVRFYVAGSDQELLKEIENGLSGGGTVSVKDAFGKLHYIVDGRKGAVNAGRKILNLNGRLINESGDKYLEIEKSIDRLLAGRAFETHLKGYLYLRHCLKLLVLDHSLIKPIQKGLFAACAEHFDSSSSNVARNLRTLFQKLADYEWSPIKRAYYAALGPEELETAEARGELPLLDDKSKYSNTMCISRLYFQLSEMHKSDKSHKSAKRSIADDGYGSQRKPTYDETKALQVAEGKLNKLQYSGPEASLVNLIAEGQVPYNYQEYSIESEKGLSILAELERNIALYRAAEKQDQEAGDAESALQKRLLRAKLLSEFDNARNLLRELSDNCEF